MSVLTRPGARGGEGVNSSPTTRLRSRGWIWALAVVLLWGAGAWAGAPNAFVVAQDSGTAAETLSRAGVRVGHVFPPHVLFVEAPDPAALRSLPGVAAVTTGPVAAGQAARWGQRAALAAAVWNRGASPQPVAVPAGGGPGAIRDDMRLVPEPIATERALDGVRSAAPPYGAGRYDVDEYMMGKVAVGIIFPESTGSGENWSSSRQSQVVSAIQQAMEWWRARRPTANLTFYYDIHLSVSTTYEPIQRSSQDEGLWISEVMGTLGYTDSGYFERVYSYDNAIRNSLNTDWAFAIFVVDSFNDPDGMFTDDYFAYAYLGGPFMVMTYDNDGYGISGMPPTCAHETGHIFYALDEYPGASSASDHSGYYNTINGNHQIGGITNVACIMRGQIAPYNSGAICSYSREQVGHRDLNTNSIEDAVDVPPETTLTPYSPDPTTQTSLTFTGSCTVVTLDNLNPNSHVQPPDDITINTVTGVQYRVDGGSWQAASASDGAFDEPQENYTFTTTVSSGTHLIEARAQDSAPNVDASPASDSVTVSSSAPVVLQTSPASGATAVSGSSALTVTFDQAMMASTINATTFIAREGVSNWLTGTVAYDDPTHTATFTADSGLPADSTITATILSGTSGVKSDAGVPLAHDHVWSFTTAAATVILSSGYATPASGNPSTPFTWRIKYWNTTNAPPDEVWVAVWSSGTGASWRRMWAYSPSDTTYTDGAWFTYTAYLAGGEWAFRFAARSGAEWAYWPKPAGSYQSGPSVNPVLLTSGYVTPSSGTPSTEFTWRIKYWNTSNAAPDAVWAAIWWQSRGKAYWYQMWPLTPSDTTYSDGAWYTLKIRGLDANSHAFRFAAQQGSHWSYWPNPAGSYLSGPTVTP